MKSIVRMNAERDSTYCPYCMRCPSPIRRMKLVAPFYWTCDCGAIHDERSLDKRIVELKSPAPVPPRS